MSTRIPSPQGPEQLELLSTRGLPLQFRLDQRTRQRGLAHIAAIKAQLAARAEGGHTATPDAVTAPRPPRRRAA